MAELKVTIGRVAVSSASMPLERGSGARTEILTIPGGTEGQEVSALVAQGGENVVTVHAEQDCWISIGSNPDAATNFNRRFIPLGAQRQFSISSGDKVSVLGHA